MNDNHLPLTFSVPKTATLNALEAVLAIARRGGLQLAALQVDSRADEDSVFLRLRASDADLLELFMARLHHVVDIADIHRTDQKVARMHVA